MRQIQSRLNEESPIPSYDDLFARYVELGIASEFERREREFKNRKSAAAIFGKAPKGLDHMIQDGRVAWIRVGGTLLIHVPTSSELLRRRERWTDLPPRS